MNPSDLAQNLRRIASAIENSKNPSRELVLKDIKNVVASIHKANDQITDEEVQDKIREMVQHYKRLERSLGSADMLFQTVDQLEGNDPYFDLNEYYPGWSKSQLQKLADSLKKAFPSHFDLD